MNESVLHDDMRSTLAADIIAACGKDLGLTKSEVKKAFCFDGGGFDYEFVFEYCEVCEDGVVGVFCLGGAGLCVEHGFVGC
jgi:hypothetical protein